MNETEKLHLQKMIEENDVEETTGKIRQLKHSNKIRADVENYVVLKKKYPRLWKTNKEQFKQMVQNKCQFIYKNYRNLFNRLLKDELDLNILAAFLTILHRIEEGEIDQHEGSYEVGKLLKNLYIDSKLRREEKEDKRKRKKVQKRSKNITWAEYKRLKLK